MRHEPGKMHDDLPWSLNWPRWSKLTCLYSWSINVKKTSNIIFYSLFIFYEAWNSFFFISISNVVFCFLFLPICTYRVSRSFCKSLRFRFVFLNIHFVLRRKNSENVKVNFMIFFFHSISSIVKKFQLYPFNFVAFQSNSLHLKIRRTLYNNYWSLQ